MLRVILFLISNLIVFSKNLRLYTDMSSDPAIEHNIDDIGFNNHYVDGGKFNVLDYMNEFIKIEEVDFDNLYYFNVEVKLGADRKEVTFDKINDDGDICLEDLNFDTISIYALTSNAIDKLRRTVIEKFKFYYISSDAESGWMEHNIKPFEDIGEFKSLLLGKNSDFIAKYAKNKVLKYCYDNKLIDNDYEFNDDKFGTLHLVFYKEGASDDDIWRAVNRVSLRDFFTNEHLTKVAMYIPIAFPVKLKFEYKCPDGTELRKEKLNYWGQTYSSAYGDEVFLASEKTLYFEDKKEITIDNIKKEVSKIMSNDDDYSHGRGYYEQDGSIIYDGDVNVKYSKKCIYSFKINIPEWSERLKSIFINVDSSRISESAELKKLDGLYIIHGPKFGDDEGKTEFINQLKAEKASKSAAISDDCINELANAFYVGDYKRGDAYCGYDNRGFGKGAVVNYIRNSNLLKPYLKDDIVTGDDNVQPSRDSEKKGGSNNSKIGLPNNSCCASCCKCCGNCCKGCKGGKCCGG